MSSRTRSAQQCESSSEYSTPARASPSEEVDLDASSSSGSDDKLDEHTRMLDAVAQEISACGKMLNHLPILRPIKYRSNHLEKKVSEQQLRKKSVKHYSTAWLVYTRGEKLLGEAQCKRCKRGNGKWTACVIFHGLGGGACANCMWQGHPEQCSIWQGHSKRLTRPHRVEESPAEEGGAVIEVSSDDGDEDIPSQVESKRPRKRLHSTSSPTLSALERDVARTSAAAIQARQALTVKRTKLGLDEDEWEGIESEELDGEGNMEAFVFKEDKYSPSATSTG